MAPIPDSPCGLRFCRDCNEFKPIGEFPKGKRRYQCRKHVEERCKQWRRRAGVSKNVLAKVWHAAYMDARAVFQRKVTKLSQADVAKVFAEKGVEPSAEFRAVPVNPDEPISPENAILIDAVLVHPKTCCAENKKTGVQPPQLSTLHLHKCCTASSFSTMSCSFLLSRSASCTHCVPL
mmetsp:Transcript_16956/g.40825  ORF Transcript_16956/g.40825 Transcript_16956/m.40825 type:complete len:178 (-) Transcript_16956:63-596(-)